MHEFLLIAPSLDNYSYNLFAVIHPLDLYPAEVVVDFLGKRYQCNTPDPLEERLREVFAAEKTRRVIASIMAQTKAIQN